MPTVTRSHKQGATPVTSEGESTSATETTSTSRTTTPATTRTTTDSHRASTSVGVEVVHREDAATSPGVTAIERRAPTPSNQPLETTSAGSTDARRMPAGATVGQGSRCGARSAQSIRTRRLLEAQLERMRRELEEARLATAYAKAEEELLQFDDAASSCADAEGWNRDRDQDVESWVGAAVEMSGKRHPVSTLPKEQVDGGVFSSGHEGEVPIVRCVAEPVEAAVKPEIAQNPSAGEQLGLAEAIVKAIREVPREPRGESVPNYMHNLPKFDGNFSDWIAFKTVYKETAPLFSDVHNMARLRQALTGTARDAVKSVLYAGSSPADVMASLKTRFGRPEVLILAELDKVRELPAISENTREICEFASQVNNVVATIRGLERPNYLHAPDIVRVLVDKIPPVLRFRWFDYNADVKCKDEPDLVALSKFLNRQADTCGSHASPEPTSRRQAVRRHVAHTATNEEVVRGGATRAPSDRGEKPACPHCQGEHQLYECSRFLRAPAKERWDIAIRSRLCFKCLQSRHRKEDCKRPPCKVCRRLHHNVLHEDRRDTQSQDVRKQTPKNEVSNNLRLPVNVAWPAKAYLKIVPVEVYGPIRMVRVLALLDEGSTVSLLDSSVAKEVGLKGPKENFTLETVGGNALTNNDSMKLNVKIKGLHQTRKRTVYGVRTMNNLNLTPQQVSRKLVERCDHLKKMASQLVYDEESPRLLIGQDNWELIVSRSTRKGKRGQPAASLTYLGWVLHGSSGATSDPVKFMSCAHVATQEDDLNKIVKEHFAVESLGVLPRRPTTDIEEQAWRILEQTTRRLDNGRFETGLLWRTPDVVMPDNYRYAENRLRNIERKLDKDANLKIEYGLQVQNLLDSGYAEEVQHGSTSTRKWYLPHFAVSHPTKTKKRLVFDAAASCAGKCLNDVLLPGPDLLQSLFGVLLRFRQFPIAVVADIKEMFLQIKIREEDRDSLRFLWRGDERSGAPREFRMTSVIFGAACSPSMAIYVKNKNAVEHQGEFPDAARAIERNHYMDDYLHSFCSQQEAVRLAGEVDHIHRQAGFELRGWASNEPSVLRELTQDATNDEVELGSKEEKTLGLRWLTQGDTLAFRSSLRNVPEVVVGRERTPTKREVTSAVMSTFDPLGLVAPVLIQGKKLIQSIWRSGIDWDDDVTPEDNAVWRVYLNNLQLLKDLKIPRCTSRTHTEGELHIFTDASEEAYACAVYWRQRDTDGRYHVALLAGKARVTPLKPVSIPRLELQAALLGTRLARSVEEELDVEVVRKTYWTDSSTVLSWIRADPRSFKTFVAHRLAEIEDTTKPQDWRWVPTAQNPADDATRGVPKDFGADHRWFTGPAFLYEDEERWPRPRTFKREPTGEEKAFISTASIISRHPTPDPARFSSWTRLLRATARVVMFVDLCRRRRHRVNVSRRQEAQDPTWGKSRKKKASDTRPTHVGTTERRLLPLDPAYLVKAERLLLQRSQAESFRGEMACVEKGKSVDRASKLKKLDLTLEDGILRLRGRIGAATGVLDNYKTPVVLDSKNYIVRLLIAYYHSSCNHGNHATVMNEIRQRFWILGLRSAVRATVHRCQWCKVYRGAAQHLPTGDLPTERLRYNEPPFTCTAVDYFGPMSVTVGRRHEKRWGALFTCLTTRAVHIELAASLSSDSVILALRRMAARRGMPKTIFSDNGTNFSGADKELREAFASIGQQDIITGAEKMGIRWKFIPPGAPNMGGAWERLVRSIKAALAVTLRDRHPKEEVLHTLILEAEHLVNSRPLVDADNEEEEALTPNHFLMGRSSGSMGLGCFNDGDLNGRRTWRVAERLADHFWQRWVKEYLPTLIPRRIDAGAATRDLRCGDIVLIVDSTLPRGTWPRGEVVKTYPGPDGRTRVTEVRTTGGVLRRPSSKLVLLVPVRDNVEAAVEPDSGDFGNEAVAEQRVNGHRVAEPRVGAAHEGEDVGDH